MNYKRRYVNLYLRRLIICLCLHQTMKKKLEKHQTMKVKIEIKIKEILKTYTGIKCSLRTNPHAQSPGQVQLDSDKRKL